MITLVTASVSAAAAGAGGLGAVARFVVDGEIRARARTSLPVGTIVINLLGSFLLGLLAGAVAKGHLPAGTLAVAGTGFCGGFTTFSTASLDAVRLLQERRGRAAAVVVAGVSVAAVVAALLGLICG